MSIFFYSLYTLAYLGFMAWAIKIWVRTRRVGTFFAALVVFGLFYDNLILSIGGLIGVGEMLYGLSYPRFAFHQLFLPWIMVAAFEQVRLAGHPWARRRAAQAAVWAAAGVVMLMGVATRLYGLRIEPEVLDGVTRYSAVGLSGPPVVSIVSIFFAGVMGLLLWRQTGWPWNLVAAVLVFVGEGIPLEMARRVIGSGVELLFMAAILTVEMRLSRAKRNLK